MKVEIIYCEQSGYEPQAVALAAELTKNYGERKVQVTLTPGSGGAFEVSADGQRIYSKRQKGEFPRYGEVPLALDMRVSRL